MAETPGTPERKDNGSASKWNPKNPAIRRILADVRELARDPSDQYAAKPVEENMFEWHFVIRGPKGTDFEGGRYHGKIILPAEYPFKPPHIIFLTPNGRWETRTKICLSMSAYHPEDWQPAWGIRTMLEALISFMPSPADGALGAIDTTPEQRKQYAQESLHYVHPLMPPLPDEGTCSKAAGMSKEMADAIAQMRFSAAKEGLQESQGEISQPSPSPLPFVPESTQTGSPSNDSSINVRQPADEVALHPADQNNMLNQPTEHQAPVNEQRQPAQQQTVLNVAPDFVDEVLKYISWFLLMAIFGLSYQKLLITFAPDL